jgi:hypothetical protein
MMQVGLEIMWFRYPWDFFWDLNAEKGYGTLFATAQLFVLGMVVLITARADYGESAPWSEKIPWFIVAFVYFFIGLDDCVGIHENFIAIGGGLALDSVAFHFIHEWLWFYGPVSVVVVIIFATLFLFPKNNGYDVCGSDVVGWCSGSRRTFAKGSRSFEL